MLTLTKQRGKQKYLLHDFELRTEVISQQFHSMDCCAPLRVLFLLRRHQCSCWFGRSLLNNVTFIHSYSEILGFVHNFLLFAYNTSIFSAKRLVKAAPARPGGMKLHRTSQERGRRLFCCSG
uniref:Putative ras-related protein RHN1 n=1 Tax=Davidia involucrata TaxID=16924 RepID=A0A5B7BQM8_DAVIN